MYLYVRLGGGDCGDHILQLSIKCYSDAFWFMSLEWKLKNKMMLLIAPSIKDYRLCLLMSRRAAVTEQIYVFSICIFSDLCKAQSTHAECKLFQSRTCCSATFGCVKGLAVVLSKHTLVLIIALFLTPSFIYCVGHGHSGGVI